MKSLIASRVKIISNIILKGNHNCRVDVLTSLLDVSNIVLKWNHNAEVFYSNTTRVVNNIILKGNHNGEIVPLFVEEL